MEQIKTSVQKAIKKLRAEGLTELEIKEKLGVSRWAVRKYGVAAEVGDLPSDTLAAVEQAIRRSKGPATFEDLSDTLDLSTKVIKAAITSLKESGKNVEVSRRGVEIPTLIKPSTPSIIDVSKFKGGIVRFGATGDNHLGSKYARLDVLNALFDIWKDQGIDTVYQAGNMIDGDARFNKFDLLAHGVHEQAQYFAENWPKRDGIVTKFVTGDDHEGWYVQREGLEIGRVLESYAKDLGRTDLVYLGHMEHDVILRAKYGESIMRIIHAGGGSAYATSYAPQKIVESYQGGEKPAVLIVGHYHKAEYGYPREVHVLQVGTTEDQTPFMRKLKIQAHVGGWTVEFELDDEGLVHAFKPQFHPFYDRKFYEQWKYRWDSRK